MSVRASSSTFVLSVRGVGGPAVVTGPRGGPVTTAPGPSEWEMLLGAGRVDPDEVGEVVEAVRAGAPPTAVPHTAHRRVDLVVHRRQVDVDDAMQDPGGHLETAVGVAGEDRGGEPVQGAVGDGDRV